MAAFFLLLVSQIYMIIAISSGSYWNAKYLQCFGDLTQVYWQWVRNRINNDISCSYNKSDEIGSVLWTQTPSDSTTQFIVLKSVYFANDMIYYHGNLQLDLIHVNSEWNHALKHNFGVWPTRITEKWMDLYPSFILKHSVYKTSSNYDYRITNKTRFMSKPDWIDFPILFYNPDMLSFWGDISNITSYKSLFEAAYTIQTGKRGAGTANFWGSLFSLYQEDITCVLLEFISSFNGGNIIEDDGFISIDNENATFALELMGEYFGNITDPNCLTYNEEDILNQFLSGNALFVRAWYSTSLSYMNYYTQGGMSNSGPSITWNITRLPGFATLGGISLAVNKNINNNTESNNYFDFGQHITSFDSSIYKWNQTQIIPPYSAFLDNLDSNTYCNDSYKYGINKTYFGSPINICSMNLINLTTTYLVSRPSYVDIVGDEYDAVSVIIQNEITKYLTGRHDDAHNTLNRIKCKLQYLLYSSSSLESVGCGNEISLDSALKISCYIIVTFIIIICLTLIVLIIIYNDHPAISSTSVTFSILLNIGAIFMSIAIICCTINPYSYQYSCIMQHVLYNLGFSLMFGSMFCSYKRVKDIFKASEKCTEIHIRDIDVLKYTGIVIFGEILCILFWFMLDSYNRNGIYLHYEIVMVNVSSLTYYYQCYLNSVGYLIINIYNIFLVCYGMILAYQTRYIRYIAFRQSYVYSVIASLFFFTVIIVHPVYFYCIQYQSGKTPNLSVIIYCLSTLFLILGTILLIFAYKLYLLFKFDADVLRKEFLIPRKNTIDTIHSIIEYSKSNKTPRDKKDSSLQQTSMINNDGIDENNNNNNDNNHSLLSSLDYGAKYNEFGFRHRNMTDNTSTNNNNDNNNNKYTVNNNGGISGTLYGTVTRSGSGSGSASGSNGRLKRDHSKGNLKDDDVLSQITDQQHVDQYIPDQFDIERLKKLGWTIKPPK